MVKNLHHFDEEQDPNPGHSEKAEPDSDIGDIDPRKQE